jgi:hypothetical protein
LTISRHIFPPFYLIQLTQNVVWWAIGRRKMASSRGKTSLKVGTQLVIPSFAKWEGLQKVWIILMSFPCFPFAMVEIYVIGRSRFGPLPLACHSFGTTVWI